MVFKIRKNVIKLLFVAAIGISSISSLSHIAQAKHISEVTTSYLEHISPSYYKSNYNYKNLTFINGYTKKESIKQIESLAAQALGISTLKHTFTYTTY